MAIPDSPIWSTLKVPREYPTYPFPKPSFPEKTLGSVGLGPLNLNDSQGSLIKRYWGVYQFNGVVYIAAAINTLVLISSNQFKFKTTDNFILGAING